MTQMIRPEHTDNRGFCYGGTILSWVDICAGIAAKRHAVYPCVTASVDAVHFLHPVKLGDICNLVATVNRSWRSSMEIGVRVETEDMLTGERRYCCHAYLIFVAIKDGKSVPVPPVVAVTPNEIRRFEEADIRRMDRTTRKRLSQAHVPKPITAPAQLESTETPRDSTIRAPVIASTSQSERTCDESYTEVVEIVFPEHANSYGITFGGQIMKWMEYCAAMAGYRHCRSHLLTAGLDSLTFMRPTKVGDIVCIRGIVSKAFDHSVEVYVTVEIEDMHTGEGVITNDGWLTMVAVNDAGQPQKIPATVPATEEQKSRFARAGERRERRLQEKANIRG
ncbi:HotDog domain-containing protein [Polychytrium aggregatum]|uniref:HotDog domain-containing protein n=1 Tax=Polychytrium aggregatum TaxID=110093 RepID=UPI0022FE4D24|nr:HotDog domain-containing protein [Polychytrium aggregatum]KAI9197473.1 HotDog domain-containing protein [Polychytrium aggregatum]